MGKFVESDESVLSSLVVVLVFLVLEMTHFDFSLRLKNPLKFGLTGSSSDSVIEILGIIPESSRIADHHGSAAEDGAGESLDSDIAGSLQEERKGLADSCTGSADEDICR